MNKELISQTEVSSLIYEWLKPFIDKCIDNGGICIPISNTNDFCWYLNSSVRKCGIGVRLCRTLYTSYWAIYNNTYKQNINIRIFDDHIEFDEDSEFRDFTKEEMVSLCEFLNNKIFINKEKKEDDNAMNNKNNEAEKVNKHAKIYTKDDYIIKYNKFSVDDLKKYFEDHNVFINLTKNNNNLTFRNYSEDGQEKLSIILEPCAGIFVDNHKEMKLSEILYPKPIFNKSILRPGMLIRFTLIDNRDIDDDDIFSEYDDCIGYITEVSDDYITIYNSYGGFCTPLIIDREYLFNDDGTPTDLRLDIRIIDEEVLYNI